MAERDKDRIKQNLLKEIHCERAKSAVWIICCISGKIAKGVQTHCPSGKIYKT